MRQSDSETSTNAQKDTQGVEPHRQSSAWDRLQRVTLTGFAVVGTLALLGLAACPADLANPGDYDRPSATGGAPAGAGGDTSGNPALQVDTACLTAIFNTDCAALAGCHKPGTPAPGAGLDLGSPGVNARLIDVPATHADVTGTPVCPSGDKLIDTANPDASWLLLKLTQTTQTCGFAMPVGLPLSDTDLACVRKYITDVAAAAGAK